MNRRDDHAHEHGAVLPATDGGADDEERSRIERVYGAYRDAGADVTRWSAEQPGNRCIMDERHRRAAQLLSTLAPPVRALEVGCGGGGVLREMDDLLSPSPGGGGIVGVDLLGDRLGDAHQAGGIVLQADGRRLPFPDHAFDLVVTFTVFSSILDADIRRSVAREAQRVLRPGGHLLWYDMRYPGPNRHIRPLGRRAVRDLFPGMTATLAPVTVLPPLARRLGDHDRSLYPLLARVPLLRSHLLGLLRKASQA